MSFLIGHSVPESGAHAAFQGPPTLELRGMRAQLDWGVTTLRVPAGDLPVTVYAAQASGRVKGATITVRVPAGTGTRLTFVPPKAAEGDALLRIDGQWPADATMAYYAARDGRVFTPMAP